MSAAHQHADDGEERPTFQVIELSRLWESNGRSSTVPPPDWPHDIPPAQPTTASQKLAHALPRPFHLLLTSLSMSLHVTTAVLAHLIDGPVVGGWSLSTTASIAFLKAGTLLDLMLGGRAIQVVPFLCGAFHRDAVIDVENSPALSCSVQNALGIANRITFKGSDKKFWRSIPGEWIRHQSLGPVSDSEPVIFYLHGGAHHLMSPGTHRSLTAQISKQTGASIFVPDYRLAPETPFPAAVEDAVACYTALTGIDHGYDFQALWVSDADPLIVPKLPIPPRRVVVMGDSSGGGLSVQFLNALKLMDIPTVAGAVLISPFLDVDLSSASWHTNWNTDYLTFDVAGMRWLMGMYCNGLPRTDPAVAPLHGDLSGLPPILIQAGASEMLRDDSIRFQARAILHGSAVKLELFRGMFHVFQAFLTVPRESQEAIRRIAAFVKEVAVPFDRKDSGMQIDAVDAVSNTSSQDTSAAATQQTHAPTEHLTQIYLGSSSAQRPQSALQRLQEREALKATSGTPVYGISPSPRPPNPIITLVSVTPTGVTEEQLHSNVIY